ncbi:hypothetical protein CCP3SC1AL1_320011 [Gammaproteobacteria bacterium]
MNELDNIPMSDREKTLVLIIRHSLSVSIADNMKCLMTETECKRIHETLAKDREERGKEIEVMKKDTKEWQDKIDSKFSTIYWFIVVTLISSVGALLMKIMDKVKV